MEVHDENETRTSRLCIAPWSRLYVFANGDVTPCFNFSSVGVLGENSGLHDVVNSARMRRLRCVYLSGGLSLGCQDCVRAQPCTPGETKRLVEAYLSGKWKKAETFGQPVDFVMV